MTTIILNEVIETFTVDELSESIIFTGVENYTLTELVDQLDVNVDNNISFTINDNAESLTISPIEEIIDSGIVEEVFDFTSSEANQFTTINYTFNNVAGITANAGQTINGHKVVIRNLGLIYHADNTIQSHQNQVIGLSLHAGVINEPINITTTGIVTEPSWSWTPDKSLFLSVDGQLTETPPTTGFLIQIAQSISPTEIWIDIKTPIFLG